MVSNKEDVVSKSKEVFELLRKDWQCMFDASGSIGRRYSRQDEIGTPFCITIDFETLENNDVTVRYRDTMKQERIKIKELITFLKNE